MSEILDLEIHNAIKERMRDKFPVLINAYLEDGQEYLDTIKNNLPGGDIKEIIGAAHSIKSASGLIGAIAIHELADTLEYAAKDLLARNASEFESLNTLYKETLETFIKTQDSLQEYF